MLHIFFFLAALFVCLFVCFHLSFRSKSDIEKLDDFEDSKIDAGSSFGAAEVSPSAMNYPGRISRRCWLSSIYPH